MVKTMGPEDGLVSGECKKMLPIRTQ